jgi:hypothetical protein
MKVGLFAWPPPPMPAPMPMERLKTLLRGERWSGELGKRSLGGIGESEGVQSVPRADGAQHR